VLAGLLSPVRFWVSSEMICVGFPRRRGASCGNFVHSWRYLLVPMMLPSSRPSLYCFTDSPDSLIHHFSGCSVGPVLCRINSPNTSIHQGGVSSCFGKSCVAGDKSKSHGSRSTCANVFFSYGRPLTSPHLQIRNLPNIRPTNLFLHRGRFSPDARTSISQLSWQPYIGCSLLFLPFQAGRKSF